MPQVPVVAYYPEDPTRAYQIHQWLPVLAELDHVLRVAVVTRDPRSAEELRGRTALPVLMAEPFADLAALYAELDPKVILYCNNSPRNFESLVTARALHVHVNHGESDKQSMASNNAKAYDRVFVAGEAAVRRHQAGLLDFDSSRLVRVGRPQLDLRRTPLLPASARRTLLYAPTWEGDADYNDYSSLDAFGPAILRALLAVPDVRVVYKPHPKVVTSTTPVIRHAHAAIVDELGRAAELDPSAGHTVVTEGDILAVTPACDLMVTDVSSVGLDWLYLHTDRPLVLTDRHHDRTRLRREVPVSRCADVVDGRNLSRLSGLVESRLGDDKHRLARLAMRRHYFDDLQPGDSTERFLEAVAGLADLRDRLLGPAQGEAAVADEVG